MVPVARLLSLFYRLMVRPRLHRSHPGSPRILQRLQTAGGFHLPDYHGGSIVNLLSSITHAMGGASPHPGLKADGSFVMLGKTFKGLTDAMLVEQTELLQRLETGRDRHTVYVRPEVVVEVAFNDVQASPQYPAGLALRFARVKRYRPDKRAEQADTIETVRAIYAACRG